MQTETVNKLPQDTEAKILQAAEREFMAKGFAGARTTSIAQAAGVTHAMFHYYFRTKEKLFDRILTEKVTLLRDALVTPVMDTGLSLEDIIRGIIDRHLDFIAANPDLPRFIITELYNNPQRSATFVEKLRIYAPLMLSGLQQKIDEAHAEGRCRKVDAGWLMLDIASLNIFSYLAYPVINGIFDNFMDDSDTFTAIRKRDNYDTIMRKLKP